MAKGPIEAFEARLRELETRVGLQWLGQTTAGGRRQARVNRLLARRSGSIRNIQSASIGMSKTFLAMPCSLMTARTSRESQELLDRLQRGHQLRMASNQVSSGMPSW